MYNDNRPDYMIRKYMGKLIRILNVQCPAGSGGVCMNPLGCRYCGLSLELTNKLRDWPRGESKWTGEDVA